MGMNEKRRSLLPKSIRCFGSMPAFTLIELLVVISIISLLVSILLPSLKRAKDLAQTAVCISNMKSLGTAALMYAADYNDSCVPLIDSWTGAMAEQSIWYSSLARNRYCTSANFQCPSEEIKYDQRAIDDPNGLACSSTVNGAANCNIVSYGISYRTSGSRLSEGCKTIPTILAVTELARGKGCIYFADSVPLGKVSKPTCGYIVNLYGGVYYKGSDTYIHSNSSCPVGARHNDMEKVNVFFFQGNVATIDGMDIFDNPMEFFLPTQENNRLVSIN